MHQYLLYPCIRHQQIRHCKHQSGSVVTDVASLRSTTFLQFTSRCNICQKLSRTQVVQTQVVQSSQKQYDMTLHDQCPNTTFKLGHQRGKLKHKNSRQRRNFETNLKTILTSNAPCNHGDLFCPNSQLDQNSTASVKNLLLCEVTARVMNYCLISAISKKKKNSDRGMYLNEYLIDPK